jgi:hypothetical protein
MPAKKRSTEEFDEKMPVERMVRDPNNALDLLVPRVCSMIKPEDKRKVLAINMMTGEYVMADTMGKAMKQFREKWPDHAYYVCRADGGPAARL